MKTWIGLGLILAGMILSVGIIKATLKQSKPMASTENSPATGSSSPSPSPSEIKSSAKVLKTEGEVSLTRNSQQSKITVDDLLYEKDIIQTSAKSSAIIVFLANDSTVRMDENSRIEISLYTRDGQDTKINLDQPFGKTWHRIKQLLGQNSSYEVNTPTVVASVRGTGFGVNANSKNATITVDDGKVNTKLVDRSGPIIKVLHEINVIKNEEAKIDSKEFQKIKDQLERGETPDLKPKRIDKDKVEEWIKTSRKEEEEIEIERGKRDGEKVESGERKIESGEQKVKEEKVESRERKVENEEIKEIRLKPTIENKPTVELKSIEPTPVPTKEDEKKEEKQPEAIIERIKDFIKGKPEEEKSKSHLDVAR